jgi:hypothetical protein
MTTPDDPAAEQQPAPGTAAEQQPSAETPTEQQPPAETAAEPARVSHAAPRRRGSVRSQGAGTAVAPPSPAAARRRLLAQDARERKQAEDERHQRTRRRVMVGSGVAIGVVGIAAIAYWSSAGSTTAHCVDQANQPAPASYCDNGSHVGSFFYFGGSQYHYYYGGSVSNGRYTGGGLSAPKGTTITTDSGKTIQRGGFGGRLSHGTS